MVAFLNLGDPNAFTTSYKNAATADAYIDAYNAQARQQFGDAIRAEQLARAGYGGKLATAQLGSDQAVTEAGLLRTDPYLVGAFQPTTGLGALAQSNVESKIGPALTNIGAGAATIPNAQQTGYTRGALEQQQQVGGALSSFDRQRALNFASNSDEQIAKMLTFGDEAASTNNMRNAGLLRPNESVTFISDPNDPARHTPAIRTTAQDGSSWVQPMAQWAQATRQGASALAAQPASGKATVSGAAQQALTSAVTQTPVAEAVTPAGGKQRQGKAAAAPEANPLLAAAPPAASPVPGAAGAAEHPLASIRNPTVPSPAASGLTPVAAAVSAAGQPPAQPNLQALGAPQGERPAPVDLSVLKLTPEEHEAIERQRRKLAEEKATQVAEASKRAEREALINERMAAIRQLEAEGGLRGEGLTTLMQAKDPLTREAFVRVIGPWQASLLLGSGDAAMGLAP